MKSKLFEQVLEECNFANLPSEYDEPMKEASAKLDFHYDKVGKDCFKISVLKERYQEVLNYFPEGEIKDLVEGDKYNLFKLKFHNDVINKTE